MKKHLKKLAYLLMALPVLTLGAGILYSMFLIDPIGTVLLSSLVAGLTLYISLPE